MIEQDAHRPGPPVDDRGAVLAMAPTARPAASGFVNSPPATGLPATDRSRRRRPRSARSVAPLAGYWAVTAGLWAIILGRPDWRAWLWSLAGLIGAGGVALGVYLNRPRRRLPWMILAVAVILAAPADVVVRLATRAGSTPLLHAGTTLYLVFFAVGTAALFGLSRSTSHAHNRSGLLDAVTVTAAAGLVVWVCVRGPWLDSLPSDRAAPLVAYLIGEVLLLGATARLATTHRATVPVCLLAFGVLAMLLSDILLGLALMTDSQSMAAGSIGYLVHHAFWGAAALHPSMTHLNESELAPAWDANDRRLRLLVLTSLAGPAALLVRVVQGGLADGVLLALGTASICLVNLVRVSDTTTAVRRFLAHREHHDALTGLANRAMFTERLTEIMAKPAATRPDATVLLVDIDSFKLLNDTLGHPSGDQVLLTVARRLAGPLGHGDLAARFGGDEFAVLIVPEADQEAAGLPRQAANRVSAALSEPVQVMSRDVRVTASIGVATVSDVLPVGGPPAVAPRHAASDLLSHAGLALQAAQAAGQGRSFRYRPDLHGLMVERLRLRAALERAVADGSFALRFQPIVALDGDRTAGFEALIRWEHPGRGVIAPEVFIKAAEETGLIEPIGEWVLRRAVQTATGWQAAGVHVSVNVSVHQLRTATEHASPSFADKVEQELAASGLAPENLMLELTESMLLGEEDAIWAELRRLREAGVHLAIDDFGTGFASMRYLLDTPIEVIKIDQAFIRGLADSPRRRALVEGMVRICADIGLNVVAEGIESPADRDVLASMGCPYGQGYLFAEPLTEAEAAAWLG